MYADRIHKQKYVQNNSFLIDAATLNPNVTIASPSTSTGPIMAQAGDDLDITCSVHVSVVDHLVSPPSVEWRGHNIDGNKVKVEMIDNLMVMLTFNPLCTSHGAVYSCVASIIIDAISVNNTVQKSKNIIVQSK